MKDLEGHWSVVTLESKSLPGLMRQIVVQHGYSIRADHTAATIIDTAKWRVVQTKKIAAPIITP